jgi:ectoine hydroxylase-related dioxygenase (phytanoyl-CoA dioxygenase family)
MGEKPKLIQDMALLKPPQGGGEKPWHQDMAYGVLTYDKPVVGVWIALDEAGVDNGCMQVMPRSHMDGGIPHYAVRDWQICDTNVPVERNVIVPLKPGGMLFFHGELVHGTAYNFSDKKRRALQFHYAPESAERVSPKEYKRMYTNEMSGAEC